MFKNFKLPSFPSLGKFGLQLDLQSKFSLGIVLCLALGVELYLSISGWAGKFGGIVGQFLRTLLGRASFIAPILCFLVAIFLVRIQRQKYLAQEFNSRLIWGIAIMILAFCGYLNLFGWVEYGLPGESENWGGFIGYLVHPFAFGFFGSIGSFFLLFFLWLAGFFLFSQLTLYDFLDKINQIPSNPGVIGDLIPDIVEFWKTQTAPAILPSLENKLPEINNINASTPTSRSTTVKKSHDSVIMSDIVRDRPPIANQVLYSTGEKFAWKLPSFEMLKESTGGMDAGNIEGNKATIKSTLHSFGIDVEMREVTVGPTVSQYTLKPNAGVKLSAIDSLQQNLALELASQSVRLESPIAGKSLVGVEIPNKIKSQVRLRDLLRTKEFIEFKDDLPIAIGLDVAGHNLLYSLAKMPHLLVAGSTGSGKSVWINSLLVSLLYKYSPQDLQLLLVDMKRVELKLYDGIPHLLSPVITDAEKAINALKWSVLEMERRYKLLEEFGKRNIVDYNVFAKAQNSIESPEMSYIVFVMDELGDLMMLAKNEVEPIIVRLTQMSRAVGIHLVLGTQRPDTGVVTGLIKANVPSRIAFAVASQIDSRVILDQMGAEKLLGQGDGLFMSPTSMRAVRFQGAYVEEKEVNDCINFIKNQVGENTFLSNSNPNITEPQRAKLSIPGLKINNDGSMEDSTSDDMYDRIKEFAFAKGMVSTSSLQTALGIGYPRARKFIEMLEEEGLCGPSNGSKPREVFPPEDWFDSN
jgi:DNA segregation ATPase FtsK/SpoIIIE, S-DNA-T family